MTGPQSPAYRGQKCIRQAYPTAVMQCLDRVVDETRQWFRSLLWYQYCGMMVELQVVRPVLEAQPFAVSVLTNQICFPPESHPQADWYRFPKSS